VSVDLEHLVKVLEARIARLEGQVADQARVAVSIPEAAQRLTCSESKARELIKSGRLRAIALGDQKIVVPIKELERFVDAELAERKAEAG
jgi:excisionase family DNA binding protein